MEKKAVSFHLFLQCGRKAAVHINQNRHKRLELLHNAYEVFKSPLDDFKKAIEEAGLGDRVTYLSHGETYNFEVAANRSSAA